MAQIVPFCAISGHFVKKIYTSTGNLFCFNDFAKPWPLTSRRAALPSIMQGCQTEPRASASWLPWRAEMLLQVIFRM